MDPGETSGTRPVPSDETRTQKTPWRIRMQSNCVINGSTCLSHVTTHEKTGAPICSVQRDDIKVIPEQARDLIITLETRATYYEKLEEQALNVVRQARKYARSIREGADSIVDHYEQEQKFNTWKASRHAALVEFINTKCEGKEYDSCFNSPCTFASSSGCSHPDHPKNKGGNVSLEGL
jgi:hypothetical protein